MRPPSVIWKRKKQIDVMHCIYVYWYTKRDNKSMNLKKNNNNKTIKKVVGGRMEKPSQHFKTGATAATFT